MSCHGAVERITTITRVHATHRHTHSHRHTQNYRLTNRLTLTHTNKSFYCNNYKCEKGRQVLSLGAHVSPERQPPLLTLTLLSLQCINNYICYAYTCNESLTAVNNSVCVRNLPDAIASHSLVLSLCHPLPTTLTHTRTLFISSDLVNLSKAQQNFLCVCVCTYANAPMVVAFLVAKQQQ